MWEPTGGKLQILAKEGTQLALCPVPYSKAAWTLGSNLDSDPKVSAVGPRANSYLVSETQYHHQ